MPTTTPIEELTRRAGTTQETGDAFADATGDQWVHTDPGGGKPFCVVNAIYHVYD